MAALAERARIASANIRADGDGIVRRMPQLVEWGGALVPTLASAAAGSRTRDDFLIDYGIRAEAFTTVSYVDVLEGRAPTGVFAGKIVFVGATALELGDVAATPVNGLTPGLMVQALGTSSLLQGRALHKVVAWPILILTIALFFAVARQCRGRHWLSVIGLGAAWSAGIFALSTGIQMAAPVMLDVAPLVLSVVTAVFASLVSRVRDLDLTVVGQSIALRRSSNLMRRVVENTFDGLLTLDRDGTIKSANPAAERILGRKSAELVERPLRELRPIAALGERRRLARLSGRGTPAAGSQRAGSGRRRCRHRDRRHPAARRAVGRVHRGAARHRRAQGGDCRRGAQPQPLEGRDQFHRQRLRAVRCRRTAGDLQPASARALSVDRAHAGAGLACRGPGPRQRDQQ